MKRTAVSLVFAVLICAGHAAPYEEDPIINEDQEIREKRAAPKINRPATVNPDEYLVKFGYLPPVKPGRQYDPNSMVSAIKNFQRMADIPQTGLIDDKTMAMMQAPRCGVVDVEGTNKMGVKKTKFKSKRSKRYAIQGYKWSKTDLTYRFLSFSRDLTERQTRDAIYRAFKLWSDVTKLTFTEITYGTADIMIEFVTRVHSDGPAAAFDGPGGVLAHAYFPENGDAHFDDDEYYTVYKDEGTNLYIVAAHEFGHSLGLGHSSTLGALMYPWYQGYVPNYELPQDDILGIQQLYGMPDTNRPGEGDEDGDGDGDGGETPSKPDPNLPKACTDPFDAIFMDIYSRTYALRGKYIWQLNSNGIEQGFPKKIKAVYKGVPGNLNAAVTSHWTQRTYFFKGERFWRFYGTSVEPGYPKNIKDTGLPKNPDAAFVWGGNGKLYIFKGAQYYEWDEYSQKVADGYPKKIKTYWKGIPSKISAAFRWENGKTYFFKGDKYWRFDDATLKVDKGYPKSKAINWMGCDGASTPNKLLTGGDRPLSRSAGSR
ncbi:matrix metalloproteinase-19-like [Ptychodera flava]|uniref:matrix metalloproteinase-19-like n=1 Tax=Ptychodera flava TaxID=63121 RepID=UPI00396A596B